MRHNVDTCELPLSVQNASSEQGVGWAVWNAPCDSEEPILGLTPPDISKGAVRPLVRNIDVVKRTRGMRTFEMK